MSDDGQGRVGLTALGVVLVLSELLYVVVLIALDAATPPPEISFVGDDESAELRMLAVLFGLISVGSIGLALALHGYLSRRGRSRPQSVSEARAFYLRCALVATCVAEVPGILGLALGLLSVGLVFERQADPSVLAAVTAMLAVSMAVKAVIVPTRGRLERFLSASRDRGDDVDERTVDA